MDGITVTGFDHLVLRCTDVETTLAWYTDVLGMPGMRVERWRAGEVPFPSVRVDDATILDLIGGGPVDDGRLDHLCLVIEPTDLAALAAHPDLDVLEGPVPRFGARGDGLSIYVRDPDGATVELRYYP
jgi:catechol 2,3-dioxygenase-like lactoylglutathione lyase family enzyme